MTTETKAAAVRAMDVCPGVGEITPPVPMLCQVNWLTAVTCCTTAGFAEVRRKAGLPLFRNQTRR